MPKTIPLAIGKFRQFGPFGPAYQIIKVVKITADGDSLVRIRVLETGEEINYRYSKLIKDPKAH